MDNLAAMTQRGFARADEKFDSLETRVGKGFFETKEEFFTRDQLYCADEAFITGTASGIIAVASADERKIGNGKMGKVTKLLLGKFKEIISGKEIEYENWLTYV